jgi:hypothetical protein
VRFEQQAQPGTHDRMIVDQDDADHSETSTASVVPAGEVSIVSLPS